MKQEETGTVRSCYAPHTGLLMNHWTQNWGPARAHSVNPTVMPRNRQERIGGQLA
jgi:hypothetical protein